MIQPTYAAAHLAVDRIYSHLATLSVLAQFSAEHAATLPDAATLAALIDSAFWTSLRREEGYVPRISLAFVAPELRVHPRLGRKEDSAPSGRSRSAPGLRMEAVEQGMAVWDLGTLLWVPSLASAVIFGSRPILIHLITLAANCAGVRSAVNPHATCDVADIGNGATENPNRARTGKPRIQVKDDPTRYRASVRPYQGRAARTPAAKDPLRINSDGVVVGELSCH